MCRLSTPCNTEVVTSADGDLRARRRRRTEREIHEATLRLATRHGFDQVTIDMISAEAGVSRRTFFNYFPSKEAAVVFGPSELPAAALAAFLSGSGAEPAQVLRDLSRLLVRQLEEDAPDRDDMRQVFALASAHPGVSAMVLASFDEFERSVATAVAQRVGRRPGDELPMLLAALALAGMRTGLQRWAHDEGAGSSPVPRVEQAMALLRSLLVP